LQNKITSLNFLSSDATRKKMIFETICHCMLFILIQMQSLVIIIALLTLLTQVSGECCNKRFGTRITAILNKNA